MINIMGQARYEDFDHFWSIFNERGAPLRKRHGSLGAHVYRHADDPNAVTILFEWESRERFEEFRADPEVLATIQSTNPVSPPAFTFLEPVGETES
jgi:quinol monooxygenase YgiN